MNSSMPSKTLQKNTTEDSARTNHRKTQTIQKSDWRTELGRIKFCEQRQDALNDQLHDLIIIANRFGFYDAADFIKNQITTPQE